jgi:hypothetical protein
LFDDVDHASKSRQGKEGRWIVQGDAICLMIVQGEAKKKGGSFKAR